MKQVYFQTLGCRLNQSETAIITQDFLDHGYLVANEMEQADICVINTCTVTSQSDAKCRQAIRSIQKNNPQALIAVIGCFSQISSEQILQIGGVQLILGNQDKLKLVQYIQEAEASEVPIVHTESIESNPFTIPTIGQSSGTTRANLKVQDGCNFRCSFCIIPKARGKSRPREMDNLLEEAKQLGRMGYQEIILSGVNIGTYEYNELGFLNIIEQLEKIDTIKRIRISSIEPTTVGKEIFQFMKDPSSKLLPYLHLPVQSASNAILERMKRRYRFEEYLEYIQTAVSEVPDLCVGSDVLVGFPGETDELFSETFENLKNSPVHYFHVFPYSERAGTPSSRMADKNPKQLISRRANVLRELSDQKMLDFTRSFLENPLQVLFEEPYGEGFWQGYSENYIRVKVPSKSVLKNQICSTRVLEIEDGLAVGELI